MRVSAKEWARAQYAKIASSTPESILSERPLTFGGGDGYTVAIASGDQNYIYLYATREKRAYELMYIDPTSAPGVPLEAANRWKRLANFMIATFRVE